jgi:hypothetical protein
MFDDALILDLPVIIKSRTDDGRRLVEVEASNQEVDTEGDVVLQAALLDAAAAFIKSGHLDIDHISEVGERIGIANPTSYIVGVPIEVKDIGKGRTSVVGELHKPIEGKVSKADELWDSLQMDPPIRWRASIFGYPKAGGLIDCRFEKCKDAPSAKRYVLKAMDWRSLAFTRNPVNDAIAGEARVVSAKAFIKSHIAQTALKAAGQMVDVNSAPAIAPFMFPPRNRLELEAHYALHMEKGKCPYAGGDGNRSIASFRDHFIQCCYEPEWEADLQALALAQLLKRH